MILSSAGCQQVKPRTLRRIIIIVIIIVIIIIIEIIF